jgi:hypothetical protein
MSDICIPDVERLARELGFSCTDAPAWIHLRNPLHLANWTLPLLEFTIVAGAILALVLAIRRQRQLADPTHLALWFSGVIYLLVAEPAIYFPRVFGVEQDVGIVFVHNVFTVDFMFDRLPLYIVAIYPALLTLAYDIVRSLGIFARRGTFVGAICVGFVHSCFYEVFDHIGPQLRWWVWNTENHATLPAFGAVPVSSIAIFSAVVPIVVTYLVYRMVAHPVSQGRRFGGGAIAARTAGVGILAAVSIALLGMPAWLLRGNPAAQGVVYWIEIAVVAFVGAITIPRAWLHVRRADTAEDTAFAKIFGVAYLAAMAICWGSALPNYFDAVHGRTASGAATGILGYAAVCFGIAALLVTAMFTLKPASGTSAQLGGAASASAAPRTGSAITSRRTSRFISSSWRTIDLCHDF